MGWDITLGASRADIIAERIAGSVAHAVRGNVLWTVRDDAQGRYIGCDLLGNSRDGWGYKGMSESVEPYYYTCPLKFLAMAPVANARWREGVREYHANQAKISRIRIGDTLKLKERCRPPEVYVTCAKPLLGTYQGREYKVRKTLIAEVVRVNGVSIL